MHSRRTVLVALVVLLAMSIAGLVLTSEWFNPSLQRRPRDARGRLVRVDQRQLTSAENLAALATTNKEREYAQETLRLADQDVDLAFSVALRHASDVPATAEPAARELAARAKQAAARVDAGKAEIERLTRQRDAANADRRVAIENGLGVADAQLAIDQDELADLQRKLARAGGDDAARLQRALEVHEKSLSHANANAVASPAAAASSSGSRAAASGLDEFKQWLERHDLRVQLADAQDEARTRAADLTAQRDALQAEVKKPHADASGDAALGARLAARLARDGRDLADLAKRIEVQQNLADVYGSWATFARTRELRSLHRVALSAFWIVVILLLAAVVDYAGSRAFERFTADRGRLHTLRQIVLVVTRVLAVVLVLLVVFGRPSQMTTAVALAGAGLTVALKDFIVGFFGWFVLIGRNGVRPGDWVEINGVQGKVIELGLLYTVILETGNWTAAGHPTGRKVAFVNSYAIEGHYFNFSTTSQWLWDEIQVGLPAAVEPYPVVDAIRKLVEAETAEGARLAEMEWQRAALVSGMARISATASVSIRTTDNGYNVTVRYVARADERVQARSRLYRAVFELLARKQALEPAAPSPAE